MATMPPKTKIKPQPERIRVEYMALDDLVRAPRNPKRHDMGALGGSVDRFGYTQPILLDEKTGMLVAGHGRLDLLSAMKAEGKAPPKRILTEGKEWLVPVVRGVSFANEAEAEAYLLADNRIVEIGGWDEAEVAEILRDLIDSVGKDGAMIGIGYSTEEAERILKNLPKAPTDVSFKSFDEGSASVVKMVECPKCKHKFPL